MGYFIVCVIAACALLAMAFYAYQPSRDDLRAAYREIKHICGNISRRGPRPALLWAVVFIFTAIGYRVWTGADLPDAATLTALLGSATIAGGLLAYLRTLDYQNGVANAPGLVSPAALNGGA